MDNVLHSSGDDPSPRYLRATSKGSAFWSHSVQIIQDNRLNVAENKGCVDVPSSKQYKQSSGIQVTLTVVFKIPAAVLPDESVIFPHQAQSTLFHW